MDLEALGKSILLNCSLLQKQQGKSDYKGTDNLSFPLDFSHKTNLPSPINFLQNFPKVKGNKLMVNSQK